MDQPDSKESNMVDELSFEGFRQAVINDYRIAFLSRQASLLGRKEVLTGKAKFGIFGDGKEIPQVAMAKFFKEGDFYAGYYRDQTFALATGVATLPQFFSQLYADPNPVNEPHSAGRQMNCHFATPFIDKEGNFLDLSKRKNFSSGMAPTAGHFPKAFGLAYASKLFKKLPGLDSHTSSSSKGDEVVFCTIGDASTSEGHFWETMNAAAVSQVPLAVFVWDDGYGISVPKELQTVKASVSEALAGFEKNDEVNGILIYKVKGWDYANLCEVFEEGISRTRKEHVPVLFHIEELTQPQGHSTSGSHERYKSPERLQWERTWDCLAKMRTWIIDNALSDEEEIDQIENVESKANIETKSAKKSSSKEMDLAGLEFFYEKNKKAITYGGGAILAIVAIFSFYKFYWLPGQEQEASNESFYAQTYFEKDSFLVALNGGINVQSSEGQKTMMGFKDIAENYGSTKTGRVANYYAGVCLLRTGKFAEAIEYLGKFKSDDVVLSALAKGAIGDAYSQNKQPKEALEYYVKAAESNKNDFTTPRFLLKAGKTALELGNKEEALKYFTDIKDNFDASPEAASVDVLIGLAQ